MAFRCEDCNGLCLDSERGSVDLCIRCAKADAAQREALVVDAQATALKLAAAEAALGEARGHLVMAVYWYDTMTPHQSVDHDPLDIKQARAWLAANPKKGE